MRVVADELAANVGPGVFQGDHGIAVLVDRSDVIASQIHAAFSGPHIDAYLAVDDRLPYFIGQLNLITGACVLQRNVDEGVRRVIVFKSLHIPGFLREVRDKLTQERIVAQRLRLLTGHDAEVVIAHGLLIFESHGVKLLVGGRVAADHSRGEAEGHAVGAFGRIAVSDHHAGLDGINQILVLRLGQNIVVIVQIRKPCEIIDEVDLRISGECVGAGGRNGNIGIVLRILANRFLFVLKERVQLVARRRHISQVEQGQCGHRILLAVLRYGVVGVKACDHTGTEVLRVHAGVHCQLGEAEGVVPAESALRLLGSQEIIRVRLELVSQVEILHEAGVKTDQVKSDAAVFDGFHDLTGGHGAGAVGSLVDPFLSKAVSESAAVIPQDEHIAVGGIVFLGPANEVAERFFFRHAGGRVQIQDFLYFAVLYGVARIRPVFHASREHALRGARLKDKGQIGALLGGLPDLLYIDGGQAFLGLQVSPDYVFHDDDALIRGVIGGKIVPAPLCSGGLSAFRIQHIFAPHDFPLFGHIAHRFIGVIDQIFYKRPGHLLSDGEKADYRHQAEKFRRREQKDCAVYEKAHDRMSMPDHKFRRRKLRSAKAQIEQAGDWEQEHQDMEEDAHVKGTADPPVQYLKKDAVHGNAGQPENDIVNRRFPHIIGRAQKDERGESGVVKGPHAGEENLGHAPFCRDRHERVPGLCSHLPEDSGVAGCVHSPDDEHYNN